MVDQVQQPRDASGIASMSAGMALAVVINQYCTWHGLTTDPNFPIAVAALAGAAVHSLQVFALTILDRIHPVMVTAPTPAPTVVVHHDNTGD